MKKILITLALVAMLTAGVGTVGASETLPQEDTNISVIDSSFTTMSKRPVTMD